nr:LysR substrate-binding domain-containing protein [Caballeronia udeis]
MLSDLGEETFADLRPDWSVRRLVDRSFAAARLHRSIAFEVNDMPILLELVAQGLAIAMVPDPSLPNAFETHVARRSQRRCFAKRVNPVGSLRPSSRAARASRPHRSCGRSLICSGCRT